MFNSGILSSLLYGVRNIRAKVLFKYLERYCRGSVLDVGGRNFYAKVLKNSKINFESWTNLESNGIFLEEVPDKRYNLVIGDGCQTPFPNETFNTVINIQVLEHVFEPIKMVKEISRVLRPGGYGIFLIPQTSVLHHAPEHYYNFTRYWITTVMHVSELEIVKLEAIGGFWTSIASRLVYFFVQGFKVTGYSNSDHKRNIVFYLMFPFMCLYALINIPMCMVFGLGDLSEEPNNHLVVVRKTTQYENPNKNI